MKIIDRIAPFALCCAAQPALAQDWSVDLGKYTLDTRTIQHDDVGPKAWVKTTRPTTEGLFYVEIEMQAACSTGLVASYQMVMWSEYSSRVIQRDMDDKGIFFSPTSGGWMESFFNYVCQ